MKNLKEIAEELASRLPIDVNDEASMSAFPIIFEALLQVRNETIEECADLVEAERELADEPDLRRTRDAILALKEKE